MPDRYRLPHRAAVRGIACLVAGVLLSAATGDQPQRNRTPENTAQQRQNAPRQNPAPLLPPVVQADIDRIAKALETANAGRDIAKESRQTEANLKAQQDIAFWGMVVAAVATFEALVTLVGVCLVGFTLKAAWASAGEAKRAANEAKRTADAAIDQAKASKRQADALIGVEIARLWVVQVDLAKFPSSVVISYEERLSNPTLRVVLRNIGKTAGALYAIEWNTFIGFALPEYSESEEPTYTGFYNFSPAYQIESRAQYQWDWPIKRPTDEEYQLLLTGGALYWVFGRASHRDFLGNSHYVKFCANIGRGGLLRPEMSVVVGGPPMYVD